MSQTLPERRSTTELQRWEPLSELEQWIENLSAMWDERLARLKAWVEQGQAEE